MSSRRSLVFSIGDLTLEYTMLLLLTMLAQMEMDEINGTDGKTTEEDVLDFIMDDFQKDLEHDSQKKQL